MKTLPHRLPWPSLADSAALVVVSLGTFFLVSILHRPPHGATARYRTEVLTGDRVAFSEPAQMAPRR